MQCGGLGMPQGIGACVGLLNECEEIVTCLSRSRSIIIDGMTLAPRADSPAPLPTSPRRDDHQRPSCRAACSERECEVLMSVRPLVCALCDFLNNVVKLPVCWSVLRLLNEIGTSHT